MLNFLAGRVLFLISRGLQHQPPLPNNALHIIGPPYVLLRTSCHILILAISLTTPLIYIKVASIRLFVHCMLYSLGIILLILHICLNIPRQPILRTLSSLHNWLTLLSCLYILMALPLRLKCWELV